jgi:hypothetical protein
MPKKTLVVCVVSLLFVLSLSRGDFVQEDIKIQIVEAADVWLNPKPSVTMEDRLGSLSKLLDIAASITTSEYKDDIQYRVDVAKELFRDDSMFNDKARQYLSFTYRMMTNGQKYEKPEELDVFVTPDEAQQKATAYAKNLMGKALSEWDAGRPGETAKLLLELVLMIVTPISG